MFNDIIQKYNLTPAKIMGGIVFAVLTLIMLSFFITIFGGSVTTLSRQGVAQLASPAKDSAAYGYAESGGADAYLSARNIAPYPPVPGTTGTDAEEFEVTDYSAQIETRHLDETCGVIEALKAQEYIVFEQSNKYEQGCSYTFKVQNEHTEEVLMLVEAQDPKDLSKSVYTIKNQIEDFTSETEILQNKLAAIDETLQSALDAYDDITKLAAATQDVETLAKIIDSKLKIIERLAQERISINEQLDRLARAKAQQLDRLDYTYFYINITENKYIDGDALRDSWKNSIKSSIREVNRILQQVTVYLVALLFLILQYALYFFIILIAVKYGYRWAKHIWKK